MKLSEFIIICALALTIQSCGSGVSPQKAVYKVYTLAQFTGIKTDPRDFKYRYWLNTEFGVSDGDYKEIIEYVEKRKHWNELEADVGYEIMKTVDEIDKENRDDLDDFAANVLVPYLWKSKRDLAISDRIEKRIWDLYERYFGLYNNVNGLQYLISSYSDYNTGGSFNARAINAVNESVSKKGLYLKFDLEQNYVCLFKIEDKLLDRMEWRGHNLSVYLVKRYTPCATTGELGYSTIESENVVVLQDKITQIAKAISSFNEKQNEEFTYSSGKALEIWRSIGINQNIDRANRIMDFLNVEDFKDNSEKEIIRDLELSVAIHEMKHKIDEIEKPEQNVNWDCEVSAHLTQIIFGNSPYYDLRSAIMRIEGFYSISGDEKMGRVLKQLWTIADESDMRKISKEELRTKIADIYYGYADYNEKGLINLDKFGKDVYPKIWDVLYN